MTKKYNLALTPSTKAGEVISYAQKFSGIADKYLLGANSHPHVTLYQFEAEENEMDSIWKCVRDAWEEAPITLKFNTFSCITFDNSIYWVSLLPDQSDSLHRMHANIADMIKLPAKKSFDPHMTLVNSKNKDYEKEVQKLSGSYHAITDTFVLSLGESDDIGQMTEILHCWEPIRRSVCRIC